MKIKKKDKITNKDRINNKDRKSNKMSYKIHLSKQERDFL